MADLTLREKRDLEELFEMGDGYVLDFSNADFEAFSRSKSVNISAPQYVRDRPTASKANRLRGFWEYEGNALVGHILDELINDAEGKRKTAGNGKLSDADAELVARCRLVTDRLTGRPTAPSRTSEDSFLARDFSNFDLGRLRLEACLQPVIEQRLDETAKCLDCGAHLAAVLLAGSILEGLLLGEATRQPKRFNRAKACPRDQQGKARNFQDWTLAQLIDVAREAGLVGEDVRKFSHALREFRNYIHPWQQMSQDFRPDADTARLCVQAMQAAINDLIENRRQSDG